MKQILAFLALIAILMIPSIASASATKWEDSTYVPIKSSTDTRSFTGFNYSAGIKLSTAQDSASRTYMAYLYYSSATDSTPDIYFTRINENGNWDTTIQVNGQLNDSIQYERIFALDMAVRPVDGSIYIAAYGETGSFAAKDSGVAALYYKVGGPGTFSKTQITVNDTSVHPHITRASNGFGWIQVATYTGATDSVYVVMPSDRSDSLVTTSTQVDTGQPDSGVFLYAFTHNGVFSDSALLMVKRDHAPADSNQRLTASNVPFRAEVISSGQNSIGVFWAGVSHPCSAGIASVKGDSFTTFNGVFFETFALTNAGRFLQRSSQLALAAIDTVGQVGQVRAMAGIFDATNSQFIVYVSKNDTSGINAILKRITVSNAHVAVVNRMDSGLSTTGASDTHLGSLSFYRNSTTGREHVAFQTSASGRVFYAEKDAGFSAAFTRFDTVSLGNPANECDFGDSNVAVGVIGSSSPRVLYTVRQGDSTSTSVRVTKPQAVAVSSSAGITVSNSDQVSGSTSAAFTVAPVASNDTQFTQYVNTTAAGTVATTSLTSSFTSPSYTYTIPSGTTNGDTITLDINTANVGAALYVRRIADTNPSSGGGQAFDTTSFSNIADTQFMVLGSIMFELKIGDTAGNVYASTAFTDTLGIRISFTLTSKFLNECNAAGIDTQSLRVWRTTDGTSAATWTQLGTTYTLSHNTNTATAVSDALSSFSVFGLFPSVGSGSADDGLCVISRTVGQTGAFADVLRSMRDSVLSTGFGRVLTQLYYSL